MAWGGGIKGEVVREWWRTGNSNVGETRKGKDQSGVQGERSDPETEGRRSFTAGWSVGPNATCYGAGEVDQAQWGRDWAGTLGGRAWHSSSSREPEGGNQIVVGS